MAHVPESRVRFEYTQAGVARCVGYAELSPRATGRIRAPGDHGIFLALCANVPTEPADARRPAVIFAAPDGSPRRSSEMVPTTLRGGVRGAACAIRSCRQLARHPLGPQALPGRGQLLHLDRATRAE